MITGNLKERILKFRKTVHPSGSRDTKTNFFTASEGLPHWGFLCLGFGDWDLLGYYFNYA